MKKRKGDMLDLDLSNAASSTECTGLMPVPPEDQEAYASYQEIYTTQTPRPRNECLEQEKPLG